MDKLPTITPYGYRGGRTLNLDQRPVKDEREDSDDAEFASDATYGGEDPVEVDSPMVTAAQPSERIDPRKARKILHDKEVRGHPLTEKQRGMFGAAADKEDKIQTALNRARSIVQKFTAGPAAVALDSNMPSGARPGVPAEHRHVPRPGEKTDKINIFKPGSRYSPSKGFKQPKQPANTSSGFSLRPPASPSPAAKPSGPYSFDPSGATRRSGGGVFPGGSQSGQRRPKQPKNFSY